MPASSVVVSVAAASILVTTTLRMASPQAAEAAEALLGTSTPATLTAQLGVTVLALTEVFVDAAVPELRHIGGEVVAPGELGEDPRKPAR